MLTQPRKKQQTVRIIAGSWRSRKVCFNDYNGVVRPTPDRVRETLFNWLSTYIVGASCLDLYAGSGILGFEALSRRAARVVAVEQRHEICKNILAAKEVLKAEVTLIQEKAEIWLDKAGQPFDIVFLDPPYCDNALPSCFQLLSKNNWVKNGSLIYYEYNSVVGAEVLPIGWNVIKEKKAGQVHYYLAQVETN